MNPLIELNNIVKRYHSHGKEILALNGVSMTIKPGEFIAVTGISGSGKSTLMNILGCLDFAERGEYFLEGNNVQTLSDRMLSGIRNRKIGFIFQGFNLISTLNALENVELPLSYRKERKKKRRMRAMEALEAVGLSQRMDHKPAQMSGGQQQRVAIARAIASNPSILLADEPTGNLDGKSGGEVLRILRELGERGRTIIMITHDPGIARCAKRRVVISNGIIQRDETS